VLFRSLRSLTGRALAAGAASALTLTLFNAAQPTLGNHEVQPGTLNDVKIALTPAQPQRRVPRPRQGLWTTPRALRPGLWTALRALLPGLLASPSGGPSPGPGRCRPPRRPRRTRRRGPGCSQPRWTWARHGSWASPGRTPTRRPRTRRSGCGRGMRAGGRTGVRWSRPATGPTPTAVSTAPRAGPTATGSGWTPGPTRSRSGSTRRPGPGPGGPRPRRWPRVGWRPT